nr:MAG: ORF1 [TTV-like mini virus]
MPPYRRNYYYRYQRRRRPYTRRRFRTWRLRNPFRFRFRRRRRRYPVRRKYKNKKKLLKILLKEFQPKTIRHCKIKGFKCLIQCGPNRESYNYAQYILSVIPEHYPTGGGWSQMVFSLASLFEDNQHLANIWTSSNAGLNLVRYLKSTFRFYQHEFVDYIVIPRLCYPMTTSPLDHANAQPYRALLERKKIIVPSVRTRPLKRRMRKFTFKPPAQLTNHWYFQQKLCNIPLLMLTTVSCSLTQMYLNPTWYSNNVTLVSLNTKLFKIPNFAEYPTTTGYKPDTNMFLYTLGNGNEKPKNRNELIKLANTKDNTPGVRIMSADQNKPANWGNPFNSHNLQEDVRLFYSTYDWNQFPENDTHTGLPNLYELSNPLYMKCRYTPDKDTGQGNVVYWVKNYAGTDWSHPENFTLKIEGLPLYIALHGWSDYTKKVRDITRVDQDHIIVIVSDFFDTKLPAYVFLDPSFRSDNGPYNTPPTNWQKTHFYPMSQQQQISMNLICQSGPNTVKLPKDTSFSIHARYTFDFKWGGCPETLEKAYDPCSQQVYPLPNQILQTTPITNPETSPEKELYCFDFRRDIITKSAADRITKHKTTTDSLQSITETSKSSARILQTLQEKDDQAQTSEKKKKKLLLQLLLQRRDQQLLKHRIFQLTKNLE